MDWSTSDTISVLSALAALGSAIYAGKTYQATVDLKRHDYGLQLQTANETLRSAVGELPDMLAYANRSRRAVQAATGLGRSGAAELWQRRADELDQEIKALQQRLPEVDLPETLSLEELKSRIVATHGFQARASAVKAELQKVMSEDDRQRDHIRDDHRAATTARTGKPA